MSTISETKAANLFYLGELARMYASSTSRADAVRRHADAVQRHALNLSETLNTSEPATTKSPAVEAAKAAEATRGWRARRAAPILPQPRRKRSSRFVRERPSPTTSQFFHPLGGKSEIRLIVA